MIRIGFNDDEIDESQYDENGDPIVKKRGDVFEDIEKRNLTVFIPERRIQQMKDEFDCVVVNDFGDEYHLSEEERIAKNKFYEAFKVFSKCKHKYRKLDEYVKAMREALKCLDFVAQNNGVYPPDEFKKMYFRNKIVINGLTLPQFKGRERKTISWDYLTDFILSDRDPSEILPNNKHDEILTPDELEELEDKLFSEGELERILRPKTEEEEYEQNLPFDVDEDDQDGKNVVVFLTNKQSKKFIKAQPEFINEIKEMRRESRKIDRLSRFVYDITQDDLEAISMYDAKHNFQSPSDVPKFKGDLMNDKDYRKYLLELEDFEKENVKVNYYGKLKSLEQIQELELKQLLEKNNWNIRNLYENKEKEAKLRKIRKRDKKREKELRDKLVAVQERRKRRLGEEVDNTSKKNKKSKKKKKKNKDNNVDKKQKSKVSNYKKRVNEDMDDFLLETAGRLDGGFKEYKEETLDWSWDNILD